MNKSESESEYFGIEHPANSGAAMTKAAAFEAPKGIWNDNSEIVAEQSMAIFSDKEVESKVRTSEFVSIR